MIRVGELALFLLPLAIFVMVRRLGGTERVVPTRAALLVLLLALLAIGGSLAWTSLRERHAEGSRYEPAQFRDGRVVPGHGD